MSELVAALASPRDSLPRTPLLLLQCFEEACKLCPDSVAYLSMAAKCWTDLTFYYDVRSDRERQLVNLKAIEYAEKVRGSRDAVGGSAGCAGCCGGGGGGGGGGLQRMRGWEPALVVEPCL